MDEDKVIFGKSNSPLSLSFLELRKKLLAFLETSDHFEAQVVIDLMPKDYLHKERALLLAKA